MRNQPSTINHQPSTINHPKLQAYQKTDLPDPSRRKLLKFLGITSLGAASRLSGGAALLYSKESEAFVPLVIAGVYLSAELVAALGVTTLFAGGYAVQKTYAIVQAKNNPNAFAIFPEGEKKPIASFTYNNPNGLENHIKNLGGFQPAPAIPNVPPIQDHKNDRENGVYDGQKIQQQGAWDSGGREIPNQINSTTSFPIVEQHPNIVFDERILDGSLQRDVLAKYQEITRGTPLSPNIVVIIYGSQVKQTNHKKSDYDVNVLNITGREVPHSVVSTIGLAFEKATGNNRISMTSFSLPRISGLIRDGYTAGIFGTRYKSESKDHVEAPFGTNPDAVNAYKNLDFNIGGKKGVSHNTGRTVGP